MIFKRKISGVAGASCFVSGDDERSGAAMAVAVAVADGRRGGSWGARWGAKRRAGRGWGADCGGGACRPAGRREAGQAGPEKNLRPIMEN